jgi:hypothetical protein
MIKLDLTTIALGSADDLTLFPWRGGRAQIIEFRATHDSLLIWMTKPSAPWVLGESRHGGVLLQCFGCSSVRFVPVWGPTDIVLTWPDGSGTLRISDGSSFDVFCREASLTGVFDDWFSMCTWRDAVGGRNLQTRDSTS